MRPVSIVIPTWNAWGLIERNLPAVLEAASAVSGAEVIVCDDGSADGTSERLEARFPSVRPLSRGENGGFALAVNDGVRAAEGEIVVCLNNDVRPDAAFLGPLLRALQDDPGLLAASPRMVSGRFGGDEARTCGVFRRGLIDVRFPDREGAPSGPREPSPILYACGGAAAFRRQRFLDLGGFSPLYHPFYWEDVDLGWRGWRRGWGSVHVPGSEVFHEGGATIGRQFPSRQVKVTYERNRLRFMWANLLEPQLWRRHLAWLGPRWIGAVLGGTAFAPALAQARGELPAIRRRREEERAAIVLSDREILKRCAPG